MTTSAFNTPRTLEALQTMNDSLESGVIYNQEFKSTKDRLNRAMEQDWDAIKTSLFTGQYHSVTEAVQDLVYYAYPQMHTVKSVAKKLAKCTEQLTTEQNDELTHALETYAVLAANMATLKGMIVMGRKPSTNPSATPERTLENTGTCSVCGRNVKLSSSGHIVSHGYKVAWGMGRSQSCAGTNYQAWEVSPAGAVNYIESLDYTKAALKARLKVLESDKADSANTSRHSVKRGEPNFKRAVKMEINSIEANIPAVKSVRKAFVAKVEGWKAQDLPK